MRWMIAAVSDSRLVLSKKRTWTGGAGIAAGEFPRPATLRVNDTALARRSSCVGNKVVNASLIQPISSGTERKLRVSRNGSKRTLPIPLSRAPQKQSYFRFPELVYRLHGVADDEQCASVALIPTRGQHLDQVELRERGVLELVDKDVSQ